MEEERGSTMESELVSIPVTPRGLLSSAPDTPRVVVGGRGSKSTSFQITPCLLSPMTGTPMKRVIMNLRGYLEEVGHLTKLNPQDAWLPITESRNGNAHYAAFHNLNAGIGFQALLLPVAFAFLGWYYSSDMRLFKN